jgi:hypothetical protein
VGRLRNRKKKEPRTECYWENEGKLSKRATGKNGRTQVYCGTWGDRERKEPEAMGFWKTKERLGKLEL